MSKIMISELTETTSAPDSSFIAIDNGEITNKITIANYNANANATAKSYAEAAQGYANDATTAKNAAVSAKTETETLVGTASSYANAASSSADAAAGSASEASGYVGAAQTSASNALASARAADASAASVAGYVDLSKSWAQGHTGARAGENTNNAKYWAEQAAAAAGGGVVTFNGRTGTVLPASGDYSSDEIAHVNSDSSSSNVETEINNLKSSRLNTYASDASEWDTTPTSGSNKPVTSGGVYAETSALYTVVSNLDTGKEDKPTVLTATLAANSTQVTFTNAAITADCSISIMTTKAGLNWTAIDDSTTGTLIITFPAQSTPTGVKLIIRG